MQVLCSWCMPAIWHAAPGLEWKQHETDVATPGDEADFPGQSHLHGWQRHELRRRHLVHPPSHSFGSIAGHAGRSADDSLDAATALHWCAYRPRGPAAPDDVARLRARGNHLVRCDTGVHAPRAAVAPLRDEHPGRDRILDVLPDGQ